LKQPQRGLTSIPLFEVHPIELVIQSQPFIKGGGGDGEGGGGDGGGGEDKGETKIKDEVGGAIDRISSAKGPSPSQWNVIFVVVFAQPC